MKNVLILFVFAFTGAVNVYSQNISNDDVKYVIFTSDKKAEETGEGIYIYSDGNIYGTSKEPPISFHFVSKGKGIIGSAYYFNLDLDELAKIRKIKEKDKLVIKEEPSEFLNSVNLVDMDILFPKMSKEEFIKVWNSLWDKTVYFIDRSEIINRKIKLYPVKVVGINLY